MIQLLMGALLSVGAVGLLVKLRPQNGEVHPFLAAPFAGSTVPLMIVIGIVFGSSLMISGLVR